MTSMRTENCGAPLHFSRRTLLQGAVGGGALWLTHVAERLALADARSPRGKPPRSVIVLWLAGGPSQLETFDPHPGTKIGGETRAVRTSVKGMQFGSGLARVAELADRLAVVRSVISKEGDHERATYNMKTGFRPDPTLVHPSIGAVLCHQKTDDVEIPRHVSILPGPWPARGGYLGDEYDAFRTGDPASPIPDVKRRVSKDRFRRRVDDLLNVVEPTFAKGRLRELDRHTLHQHSFRAALRMMSSDQLKAFDVSQEPQSVRDQFGDTPFGRGCLAAVRLIGVGVRCVEVTLTGWDSHTNNHATQHARLETLDPAFASLIRELERRELFDDTLVVCAGEFGRTPHINDAGGRDHWPHGFSVVLGGGRIRGGAVYGETNPRPRLDRDKEKPDWEKDLVNPRPVEDIHATIYRALEIDYEQELQTPIGRPMVFSKGTPIRELLVG